MKTLFKTSIVIIVMSLFALAFTNCKKGEDDPFFSIKSRKARLVGKWELKSGDLTETFGSGSESITYNYSDIEEDLEFEKDNTYSINRTMTCSITFYDETFTFDLTQNESGSWSFGGENKDLDLKNKEYLIMNAEDLSYTMYFEGDRYVSNFSEHTYMLILTKLSNKELSAEIDDTHTEITDDYMSISKFSGELTYEKKK